MSDRFGIENYVAGGYSTGETPVDSLVSLPRSLTAENGAKALLIGEFHEICTMSCPECDGDDETVYDCSTCKGQGYINRRVPVEWDTIKRIYAKIVEHFTS